MVPCNDLHEEELYAEALELAVTELGNANGFVAAPRPDQSYAT
jgi:hypothetical protein